MASPENIYAGAPFTLKCTCGRDDDAFPWRFLLDTSQVRLRFG